ncbi:uncharacterized protein LOC130813394 [Amaranthus tricolor]|uniref:uncharacterized protein LOC130813394 n=1 Tax=Amaranthus tricolor TaxID=29722 RepID=UPI00258BC5AD|nr:uncharacterized protein LOC130813394 [Amaranthus tricolor]
MAPFVALYGRRCRSPRHQEEFNVGDGLLLRVSPKRGVVRFGARGKLSPRFISPHEILERVDKMDYRLALPDSLEKVHDLFHVSQLKTYFATTSHVLDPEPLELHTNLSSAEQPVRI